MNIIDLSSFKGARPPQPSESSRAKGRSYGRDRQVPEDPGETQTEDLGFRDRACVKREIEAHIEARRTYQAAVSWLAAAEAEISVDCKHRGGARGHQKVLCRNGRGGAPLRLDRTTSAETWRTLGDEFGFLVKCIALT
jgi:hypothetical protein